MKTSILFYNRINYLLRDKLLASNRLTKDIANGLEADVCVIEFGGKEKLLEWMHDPGYLYREQELYSDAVANFAKENDVFLIDLRKQFLLRRDSPKLMCEDGIHPNVNGHIFMATYLIYNF